MAATSGSSSATQRLGKVASHLSTADAAATTAVLMAQPDMILPELQTKEVTVMVSNRHVHVTDEDVERLFGPGYELTFLKGLAGLPKDLAMMAGYAAEETVDVINPLNGKTIPGCRILGPPRVATQVELSYTDCRNIGLEAPTRISGDTANSAPVTLVAPNGKSVESPEGVIRAWRHAHMSNEQAAWLGLQDGQMFAIRVNTPMSSVVLMDVLVRILNLPEQFLPVLEANNSVMPIEVHLDTDEGNACMIQDATSFEVLTYDPADPNTLTTVCTTDVSYFFVDGQPPNTTLRRQAALPLENEPRPGAVSWASNLQHNWKSDESCIRNDGF